MNASIAKAWFDRVWNRLPPPGEPATRAHEAIHELFAKDGVALGIYGEEIKGPGEFVAFHDAFRSIFHDVHIDVVHEVVDGDFVAIECRGHATFADKKLPLTGAGFVIVRDGQIQRAWNHWNFLSLLEAMELLPGGSFELAITGKLEKHPQATSVSPSGDVEAVATKNRNP